jgi:imidazolonepropionase-like amidohydrolase
MYKAICGARLFDGSGAIPIKDGVLLINGEKIEAAGARGSFRLPSEAEIIDASGMTVIPGLIDAHIHLDLHGMADTYQENQVEDKLRTLRAAKEMEDTLRAGFTTVRNVGSCNGIDFAVKQGIEAGYRKGPRILTAGRIVCMTCSGTEYFDGMYRVADGADECRKAAREQLKKGADFLKLMATGAVMNPGGVPGAAQLNQNEIRAVVEEGLKLGKHTAAHAHAAKGIINAVKAGCRTIEHGTLADEAALEAMAQAGAYLVPTLCLHALFQEHAQEIPKFMVEKSQAMQGAYVDVVRQAMKVGVKLALGTDVGVNYFYHGINASEIVYYVKSGIMSAMQALVTATRGTAEAIMMDDLVGSLQPGKLADFVVLKQDPLADIQVLTERDNIAMVFKGGESQF